MQIMSSPRYAPEQLQAHLLPHDLERLRSLHIVGRDGKTQLLDIEYLHDIIERAVVGYEHVVQPGIILKAASPTLYDGMRHTDLIRSLILVTVPLVERDPAYSYVASRFLLAEQQEDFSAAFSLDMRSENFYQQAFLKAVHFGLEHRVYDAVLAGFDLEKLAAVIVPERDALFGYTGLQILHERYFAKAAGKRIELPQIFWMRVAMGLAIPEADQTMAAITFYHQLSTMRYVASTPTLFHSATVHPQLSSCYLTTIYDDLHHIFKCLGDNAQLSKWSGGIGNDWSYLRATGATIKTIGMPSQGVIPFLKIANDVTGAISRSGSRRGATVAYLEAWHFDFEDFLDLRRNTGDERRRTHDMNTAAWVPDFLMKRVDNDGEWTLFSPEEVPDLHDLYGKAFETRYQEYEQMAREGKIRLFKTMEAKTLWRKMLTRLFETGHPWITFKDPCNIRSPQDHVGVVHSSNLCTEITLNTSNTETAVCNLGSINLEKHVADGTVDYEMLAQTVRTAVRMLDNVVDINFYPTAEAKNSNLKHRPVGLGIMGFQDALYKLDLAFDDPQALEVADYLMEFISYHAILASSELAAQKGVYGSYKGSKWDRGIFPLDSLALLEQERGMAIDVPRTQRLDWDHLKGYVATHGMRNSNVMAIAPTATISNIAGTTPSFEPIYKNIYVKANMSGEFTVVNHYLVEDLKKLGLWNAEMLDKLKYFDGSIQGIAEIPDHLKHKYKEAFEVDAIWLLKFTAARGKWIDQSQSHNIFLKGATGKVLHEVYMAAWKLGLKTTYYLRTLAATQIEKSTLDTKFGFTQKREYGSVESAPSVENASSNETETELPKACSIENPECESCQ